MSGCLWEHGAEPSGEIIREAQQADTAPSFAGGGDDAAAGADGGSADPMPAAKEEDEAPSPDSREVRAWRRIAREQVLGASSCRVLRTDIRHLLNSCSKQQRTCSPIPL